MEHRLLEERIVRLERRNARLQTLFAATLLFAVTWPLLAAHQGETSPSATTDSVVIQGPNESELRLENRGKEGLGLFLMQKGKVRASLALHGDDVRVALADAKGKTSVVHEATKEDVRTGVKKGDAWQIRDELRGGKVPIRSFFDSAGVERLRQGLLKNEPVVVLRDREGKDRAWMVVEQGPHASIVVRGSDKAEAALHARPGAQCGFGLRSEDGKMKVGIIGDNREAQVFVYAPDENHRVSLFADAARQSVESIDAGGITRAQMGVVDGKARAQRRDAKGQVLGGEGGK